MLKHQNIVRLLAMHAAAHSFISCHNLLLFAGAAHVSFEPLAAFS